MRADLLETLKRVNTKGWKKVKVEFTGGPLVISVPPDFVDLTMKRAEVLKNPAKEIQYVLERPCGGPTLEEVARGKGKEAAQLKVAITTSDTTRPVPYHLGPYESIAPLGPGGMVGVDAASEPRIPAGADLDPHYTFRMTRRIV